MQNVSQKDVQKHSYLLGVDTGGTYTDSVLLDYESHEVLSSAKSLTTYDDLAKGVSASIEQLDIEKPEEINLVGISSTLATNSVGEEKIRKTGLILVGYDRELVENYDLGDNFSAHTVCYFQGGHTSQGEEQAPLDLEGVKAWVEKHKDEVDALAVSSYFSPLNPTHENEIEAAVEDICDLPVVLGHQLSTKLDSIKRASTACLNASLVAVMHEFIEAVHRALEKRGIDAPLMVVKGDGSLIPHAEATHRPVETVLSGPAASTIGGKFLSSLEDALVVDMGGTTTDIALLNNGKVAISEDGPAVGPVKTAVKAAEIRTAVVGCDSRIAITPDNDIMVGPERVVPISRLAADSPEVLEGLRKRNNRRNYLWKASDLVYWFLYSDLEAEDLDNLTAAQKKVIDCISDGPKCLSDVLSAAGVHHEVQLNPEVLFNSGCLGVATLTPSDLLHVKNVMDQWSSETAEIAAENLAAVCSRERDEFIDETLDMIVSDIVEEAIVFLARESADDLPEVIDGDWGQWLFEQSVSGEHKFLSVNISSKMPIIGIGAPAGYFIKRVAETLDAEFISCKYAEVANAVGAVVGLTIAEEEAIVHVRETGEKRNYIVQADGDTWSFEEEEEAFKEAKRIVSDVAGRKCEDAGVVNPQVSLSEKSEGHLKRITARAAGNIALSD